MAKKNPHAVAMGRAGGKARAKSMTKAERSANAKQAVNARWAKEREAKEDGAK